MKETPKKGFLVIMSRGKDIQIEDYEVKKVVAGIGTGGVVAVKQGFINPSFFVDIVVDKARMAEHADDNRHETKKIPLEPLKNVFDGVKLRLQEGDKPQLHD